jgi:predicted metal-dependent hydrolase
MIIDAELPEIQVAMHPRAKQLKLAVSAKGIRLTVPPFASQRQVMVFLENSKVWLKQTWQRQQQLQPSHTAPSLPHQLQLCYEQQPYQLEYSELGQQLWRESVAGQRFELNQSQAAFALTALIRAKAQLILPQQLLHYAQRHCLKVNALRIATPRSRWGSCSHDQRIMLHAGILLMPKAYADYVLLHELAHTLEMNHQAGFWQLLEQMYPHAKQQQREVKTFKLPSWWQTQPSI